MKKNPFTSPRYIILSILDGILIALAVIGYVKLEVIELFGEGFKDFVFENWLALGIAGVIILSLNAYVSIKEHMENIKNQDSQP